MNITYNKAMIELVYEIRRRVQSDIKPSIKLANPELLVELVGYYQTCKDTIVRALIKELMEYAGNDWQARLNNALSTKPDKHIMKAYRGHLSVEPTKQKTSRAEPSNSGLIYRGQVVRR